MRASTAIRFAQLTHSHSVTPGERKNAHFPAPLIQVAFAVAAGGFCVATFSIGPTLLNGKVRNLGALLRQPRMRFSPVGSSSSLHPPGLIANSLA